MTAEYRWNFQGWLSMDEPIGRFMRDIANKNNGRCWIRGSLTRKSGESAGFNVSCTVNGRKRDWHIAGLSTFARAALHAPNSTPVLVCEGDFPPEWYGDEECYVFKANGASITVQQFNRLRSPATRARYIYVPSTKVVIVGRDWHKDLIV